MPSAESQVPRPEHSTSWCSVLLSPRFTTPVGDTDFSMDSEKVYVSPTHTSPVHGAPAAGQNGETIKSAVP